MLEALEVLSCLRRPILWRPCIIWVICIWFFVHFVAVHTFCPVFLVDDLAHGSFCPLVWFLLLQLFLKTVQVIAKLTKLMGVALLRSLMLSQPAPARVASPGGSLLESSPFRDQMHYTSIDPKQQQTMFPRRSCAIKTSWGAPFLRKETKEKKGDKPRNPEPEGARKSRWNTRISSSWERKEKISRETSPEP